MNTSIVNRYVSLKSVTAGALLLVSAPSVAEFMPGDPRVPWSQCLVDKVNELLRAPDEAASVARAAMALCSSHEAAVRSTVEAEIEAKMVRDGTVRDAAEAHKIQSSISDRGWHQFVAGMENYVAAIVVQKRAARGK